MARRSTRRPGSRPAPRPARPAAAGGRPGQRPGAPAPQEGEPARASTGAVALFLAVAGLLTSLVLWPLSVLLGAAGVVVGLRALRHGGPSPAALGAVVVGGLALLSSAAYVLLAGR